MKQVGKREKEASPQGVERTPVLEGGKEDEPQCCSVLEEMKNLAILMRHCYEIVTNCTLLVLQLQMVNEPSVNVGLQIETPGYLALTVPNNS